MHVCHGKFWLIPYLFVCVQSIPNQSVVFVSVNVYQDCFRARGRHVGVCTKGFYYGSCCSLSTYSTTPVDQDKRPVPVGTILSTTDSYQPQDVAENLPRVPIALENNAIDGPTAAWSPSDPLDLSYWPNLLADIYGMKPPTSPQIVFPYSTFHFPVEYGDSFGGQVEMMPIEQVPPPMGSTSLSTTTTTTPPTTTPSTSITSPTTTSPIQCKLTRFYICIIPWVLRLTLFVFRW